MKNKPCSAGNFNCRWTEIIVVANQMSFGASELIGSGGIDTLASCGINGGYCIEGRGYHH